MTLRSARSWPSPPSPTRRCGCWRDWALLAVIWVAALVGRDRPVRPGLARRLAGGVPGRVGDGAVAPHPPAGDGDLGFGLAQALGIAAYLVEGADPTGLVRDGVPAGAPLRPVPLGLGPRRRATASIVIVAAWAIGVAHRPRLHRRRHRRGGRALRPGRAGRHGAVPRRRPRARDRSRPDCSNESSSPASCTTPSPTTSRPSRSRPRPVASWLRRSPTPRWTPSASSRRRRRAPSTRCARWSARCGEARRPSWRRSPGVAEIQGLATTNGGGPAVARRAGRRPRRPAPLGRRRHLPARPGVDHQRRAPRPPRHPRRRAGRRWRRRRAADGPRRRRVRLRRRRRVAGLRAASGWPSEPSCSAAPSTPARAPDGGWTVDARDAPSGGSPA